MNLFYPGLVAAMLILYPLAAWFIWRYRERWNSAPKCFVLLTCNGAAEVEWHLRRLMSRARWRGQEVAVYWHDCQSQDETAEIVQRMPLTIYKV